MISAASIAWRLVSPFSVVRAIGQAFVLPITAPLLIARAILRGCRSRRPVDPTILAITSPAERYIAVVGDRDLRVTIWRKFAVWFVAATASAAWSIMLSRVASPLTLMVAISLTATLFLGAASAALAHWQARTKRLGTLGEWLRQPHEWLPPGSTRLASLLLVFVSALLPGAAIAAPVTSDSIAQSILSALLPSGGNAATHAIGVLSSWLAFAGIGLIALGILHGMAAMAETGQHVMERTSLWAWIRVAIGVGMLLPMPNGISPGHHLLLAIASDGSQRATDIASGYFSESLSATMPPPIAPTAALTVTGRDLAHQILAAELCAIMRANEATNLGSSTRWIEYPPESGVQGYEPGDDPTTGSPDSMWWDWGSCGSISLPITTTPASAATFGQARIAAVSRMITDIRGSSIATEMADENGPWPPSILPTIQPFINSYNATLQTAATTFVGAENSASTDAILQQLRQQGWPVSGTYAMTVSTFLTSVDDQASTSPDIRRPTPGRKNVIGLMDSDVPIDTALKRFSGRWKQETTTESLHAADLAAVGDNSSDLLTKALAPISQRLSQAMITAASTRGDEPLVSVVSLGHDMLLASEAGTVTGLVLATAANTAPSKLLGGDGAWSWVSHWVRFVIDLCFGIGTFLAYYLPIIPAISIYWLLVNWVLLLAEACVAMPVLAFLFCRLEGQELVDSVQKPGISILFNLYLKPAFGVYGLILAQKVSPLLINALAAIFPASYAGAQGGHFVGVVGQLFGLALFGYLIVKSQIEIGQLVTLIPDRIPRWMGLATESTGGQASGVHAAVIAKTGAGGGGGGMKPRGGGGGGGGGGGSIRPDRRSSGRDDPSHWGNASGGSAGLDEKQMSAASAAYDAWAADFPGGAPHSFDDYVSFVQERRAEERQG